MRTEHAYYSRHGHRDLCVPFYLSLAVYPGGLAELRKKAAGAYKQIGIAKCEWARLIGAQMSLTENASPSFHFFVGSLTKRIETA